MLTYAQATVDKYTIGYATDGSGPPLLLLHGLGFDHQLWAAVAPYLIGHTRVLIPDLPGFGRSRAAAWDGSPDVWLRSVAGFMTATQAIPAFVAGVGLGGTLAMLLAARYPERVRAGVVIGAPAFQLWPAGSAARMGRLALGVPGMAGMLARFRPEQVARRWLRASLASEPDATQVALLASTLRTASTRQHLLSGIRQIPQWASIQRQFGGVRAPLLLLWGEHDQIYPLPWAERLRHALPNAQLVSLPKAGHLVPLEQPAELAASMRQFFGLGQRR